MADVSLICGKICSGKSTFAKKLAGEKKAVILSCDEIMTLFPPLEGDEAFGSVSEKVKRCLLQKAADIAACGANVILDWGFWRRTERKETTVFFEEKGIPAVWYYLDISDARWQQNIQCRNENLGPADYYADEGLLQKCLRLFEAPDDNERRAWRIVNQ